jgi:hypothetical protein
MEKTIKIATNLKIIEFTEKTIDFPDTSKYYSHHDDGAFFGEGLVLFAIIPLGEMYYRLVRVSENTQKSTDFSPMKDCKSEYWLKDDVDTNLRKRALGIIMGNSIEYSEISELDFYSKREELLNHYKNW